MARLKRYHEKRDFDSSNEPRGAAPATGWTGIFVVQHHRASHDHDDFRLEWNGVLKSWAIPKRVSRVIGERRLAVEVEDHPIEYASFEGTIPEGNYGAGTVEIWDQGTWTPDGDVDEGLRDGKLTFQLHGGKLTGHWALIRTGTGAKPSWLLFKRKAKVATRAPKKR